MATSVSEEIKVGTMAIRYLVEGDESGGSVALFEFDVPAGMKSPPDIATTSTRKRSTGSRAC